MAPATASAPYTDEAPPVISSTRSMRAAGMVFKSTRPDDEDGFARRPLTRMSVRPGPKPRKSAVAKPFSDGLFDVMVTPGTTCGREFSSSSELIVPVSAISSAPTVAIGLVVWKSR